ncbi:MAG: FG-GAP-like repeat-containing protein, partial [bacterium]
QVMDGDSTHFNPGTLAYNTQYFWKVIAKDTYGNSTIGSQWTFTTVSNEAPTTPDNPDPADLATGIAITSKLSWTASTDQEEEAISYKVFFDTVSPPATQVADGDTTNFDPDTLVYGTQYYWQVKATDTYGNITNGPEWTFTTVSNEAPTTPDTPTPDDFATDVAIDTKLSWAASTDTESDTVLYDVYFDTVDPPLTQVVTGGDSTTFDPGLLAYDQTYYWYVVAKDSYGNPSTSSTWTFTTVQNYAPTEPDSPYPDDFASGVAVNVQLGWLASTDAEGETVSYVVLLDTLSSPATQVMAGDSTHFNPGGLAYDTQYFWKVIASDTYGNSTDGSEWTFTTVLNDAPTTPDNPTPEDLASDVAIDTLLSWAASTDAEGETILYDVYFDTVSSSLEQVVSDGDSTTFDPGLLAYDQTYYWYVVAKDSYGNPSSGPTWTFTTVINQPPSTPVDPLPANLATDITLDTLLAWSASTDVDGETVVYDVFFDTVDPPVNRVVNDGDSTNWRPSILSYNTTYYWQVIAEDTYGNPTSGPVWSFTTLNILPSVPSNPSPFAGETGGVDGNTILRWTCGDRDGDPLTFDVYFGGEFPPTLVSIEQDSFLYVTETVSENNLYYWKVVAHDTHGGVISSPMWSFRSAKPLGKPFFTLHVVDDQIVDPSGVATADFDLDGDQDIVDVSPYSAATTGKLHWWENLGTGWTLHPIAAEPGVYINVNVSTADVDADGDVDIITNRNQEVQYWENIDSGSGWSMHVVSSSSGDRAMAVDLDNDGVLELLDSDSHWWDWNGTTWTEFTYAQESNTALHWGDIDNDGDLDVIGTMPSMGEIVWWENSGDASSWTEQVVASNFSNVLSVYASDMDGDRDLDIVAGSNSSGEIAWWENVGDGESWTKHSIGSGFQALNDLKVSDFDYDGDMDLLAGSGTKGVLILENTGDSWTVQDVEDVRDSTGFTSTYRLSISDMDGDGDLDIVAQNKSGRQLAWFESQSNNFPSLPDAHSPTDGSEDIAINTSLMWGSTDVNGDTLRYDLFFDTVDPPLVQIQSNDTSSTYNLADLEYLATYYWKVVVSDGHGGVVEGDVWSFTTVANQPPSEPSNPFPDDLAFNVTLDVQLTWDASTDPEGQAVTYRVYFGTSDLTPLPLVGEQSGTDYSPTGLVTNTAYMWRVVAVDALDDSTEGSNWSFTTLNTPPSPFALLSPAMGDTNHTGQIDLNWEKSFDPDAGSSIEYIVEWSLNEDFGTVSTTTLSDTFFTITGLDNAETTSNPHRDKRSGRDIRTSDGLRSAKSKALMIDDSDIRQAAVVPVHKTSGKMTVPLPDDSFLYIRVSAKDDHDAVTWADGSTSGIRVWLEFFDPPLAFSLLNPVMDATCYSLDTTLAWESSTDPDPGDVVTYSVYLGNLPDLSDAEEVATGLQNANVLLQNLEPFSEFYWTVHAQDLNTPGTWASDTLHFSTHHWRTTLTMSLNGQRFEWISFCFLGNDKSVSHLFSGLTTQFVMLRDDAGKVTIPNKGIDEIGQIDPAKGYQVFLNADASLTMNGLALHPATSYTIRSERWNLLVNPLIDTTMVETAFRELSDHLIAVQNDVGEIWAPQETVKTLTDVIPGVSYQILVDQTITFVYGTGEPSTAATASSSKNVSKTISVMAAKSSPAATGLPYTIFVTLDPDFRQKDALVIELLDGEKVVGASVLPTEGEITLVTAWKGIPEFDLEGFTSGSSIRAQLKDADGKVIPVRLKGSGARYGEGGYGHIEIELIPLPEHYEVSKPYPNPFNPTATIVVALPEPARVRIEVYNILGQRVDVLQDGVMTAGYNRVLMDGSRWASGLYFVRVSVLGQKDELRKMVLIR